MERSGTKSECLSIEASGVGPKSSSLKKVFFFGKQKSSTWKTDSLGRNFKVYIPLF